MAVIGNILNLLGRYVYGIGWLAVCLAAIVVGIRLFRAALPIDLKQHLEERNLAVALVFGLFLVALIGGIFFLAGHLA